MKRFALDQMTRGWFVGDFEPNCLRTKSCEVGVKHYAKGTVEQAHLHRVVAEVTLVVSGRARVGDMELRAGQGLLVSPGEVAEFEALEDTVTVVVKLPSVPDDKYVVES